MRLLSKPQVHEDSENNAAQAALQRYYRLHAPIYDATRWSFLFGRQRLLQHVARHLTVQPQRILEVGCGTGRNVLQLGQFFPHAQITGCDLSEAMLMRARSRLDQAVPAKDRQRYELVLASAHALPVQPYDLIVCSYMLSMTGPALSSTLELLRARLASRGVLAVVDFHRSAHPWFRAWMQKNHVRLDGALEEALLQRPDPMLHSRHSVAGLWQWLMWIGS
jgi:S-adenosylmethionine-diacylgycerolhomoserine-N-methlytransferase